MKAERLVSLVVADERGVFRVIDGKVAEKQLRQTLEVAGFTPDEIEMTMQVVLGNEDPPVPFREGDT